jgi:hypothetical protein
VVVQADDVAGVGRAGLLAFRRHERDRIADADFAAEPRLVQAHAGQVFAGTHAHEGDPVAMRRIHIGLDLEHEGG